MRRISCVGPLPQSLSSAALGLIASRKFVYRVGVGEADVALAVDAEAGAGDGDHPRRFQM